MADYTAGSMYPRDAAEFARGRPRLGETAKMLPVAFVVCNIAGLWAIYMWFHIVPLLRTVEHHDQAMMETGVFSGLAFMLIMCYVQCIVTHPGTIPDRDIDPTWEYVPIDGKPAMSDAQLLESKKSGDRRFCKWCTKYKPDRCHHCRVCRTCILKMDHHCPWIYNCVGFRNHKYFFLLLLYSAAACHFITWTMLPTVLKSTDTATPFPTMFLLLFGETLAAFIGILVTVFFAFHVWLMFRAMTTIEFCEKTTKSGKGLGRSPYDRGIGGNIRAVLGDNPFFWLLPTWPPSGSGLYFKAEDDTTRLVRDLEGNRGQRRKSAGSPGGSPGDISYREECRDSRRESRRAPCYDPSEAGAASPLPTAPNMSMFSQGGANYGGYGAINNEPPMPTKQKRSTPRDQRKRPACC